MKSIETQSQVTENLVPRWLETSLYLSVCAATLLSTIGLQSSGASVFTYMLDGWFLAFLVTIALRSKISHPIFISLLLLFAMSRFIPALYFEAPQAEFFRAYRWILYGIVFALAIDWRWQRIKPLVELTWSLSVIAAIVYFYKGTFLDQARPTLFLENNFEIPMFIGLIIVCYQHMGKHRFISVILMGLLVVLSGSRSGALAFACLAGFIIWNKVSEKPVLKFFLPLSIPILIFVPFLVFDSRSGGPQDRMLFFNLFLYETQNWSFMNWLFGTTPITPLSPGTCSELSFWQSLMFSIEDSTCYSAILHSFGLRIVFDAGILGAIIVFGTPILAAHYARVPPPIYISLSAIAATNALSVSSLNNPYMAISFLMAILTAPIVIPQKTNIEALLDRKNQIRE